MRDLPDGPTLLALAQELSAEILATLPPEERTVTEAMIVRARAIAKREAAAGEPALAPVGAALRSLYGEGDPFAQFRRLADDIRTWRHSVFDHSSPPFSAERSGEVGGGSRAVQSQLADSPTAPNPFAPKGGGGLKASPAVIESVRSLLWMLTLQKLRESNPGFLAAHGLE